MYRKLLLQKPGMVAKDTGSYREKLIFQSQADAASGFQSQLYQFTGVPRLPFAAPN